MDTDIEAATNNCTFKELGHISKNPEVERAQSRTKTDKTEGHSVERQQVSNSPNTTEFRKKEEYRQE